MTPKAKMAMVSTLHWVQLLAFAAMATIMALKIATDGADVVSTGVLICGILGGAATIASRFVSGGTWNPRHLERRLGERDRSYRDDT